MSFQEQAESLASRLHLQAMPRAAYGGLCVLLVAVVAVGAVLALQPAGAFQVEAAAVSHDEGASVVTDGETRETEGVGLTAGADSQPLDGAPSSGTGGGPAALLCVHVDGAVASPGVYYLAEGSRVADAVAAAGGVAGDGCTAAVNLAQMLQDGQQILVPTQEAVDAGAAPGFPVAQEETEGGGAARSNGLVSINRASVEELQTLSGIGEATARKIVADRDANGPFASLEDLMRVSGIGEKKFAALRDSLCL